MEEIATREGIDNSYVSWMVNLTRLAQDVAILDDALPDRITLFDLAVNLAAAAGRPACSAQVGAQETMLAAIWTLRHRRFSFPAGNDAIQPLEPSARNPSISNGVQSTYCGLRAIRGERDWRSI